jgi:hypothetical protein
MAYYSDKNIVIMTKLDVRERAVKTRERSYAVLL